MRQDLIERERELAVVTEHLDAVAAGIGGALVVEGAAGAGVTALLDAAVGLARDREMRIARVVATARAGPTTPTVARRWIHSLSAAAGTRADAALAVLAAAGPLVLVVDNAHEADDASIEFATELARGFLVPGALVVAGLLAAGSGAPKPSIAALKGVATVLRARPLTARGCGALLSRELGTALAPDAEAAAAAVTFGSPALLVGLAAELAQAGFDPAHGGADVVRETGERIASRSVRERLTQTARIDVAEVVALVEPWATPRRIARLLDRPTSDIHKQLDALVGCGLLSRADRPTFARRWERDAIVRTATLVRAQAVRGAAATLLADDGEPLGAGTVLLAVDPAADPRRCTLLRAAAGLARRADRPELAIRLLRRLLAEPVDERERTDVIVELGTTQVTSGMAEGLDTLRGALNDAVEPHDVADAAAALGWALAGRANGEEAADALLAARGRLAGSGLDVALDVQIAEMTAWDPGLRPARRAVVARLAQAEGSRLAAAACLAARAVDETATCGSAPAAAALAQRALADGALADSPRGAATALSTAMILGYAGYAENAIDHVDHTIVRLRANGLSALLSPAVAFRGALRFMLGRLAQAEADLRAILTTPWLVRSTPLSAGFLVLCLLERGDDAGAAKILADLDLEGGDLQLLSPHAPFLHARGELRARRGDRYGALDDLRSCGRRLVSAGWSNPTVAPWRGSAARVLMQLGEPEEARALAAEEVRLAERFGAPASLSRALRARAATVGAGEARGLLARAATVATGVQTPIEEAAARIDLAQLDVACGAFPAARRQLHVALARVRGTGAGTLASRAGELLAAAGGRASRTDHGGVAGLTRAERRVALLAAQGRTNAEISSELVVSRKTVETHLRNAFRKLAISSRAQLPEVLERPAALRRIASRRTVERDPAPLA